MKYKSDDFFNRLEKVVWSKTYSKLWLYARLAFSGRAQLYQVTLTGKYFSSISMKRDGEEESWIIPGPDSALSFLSRLPEDTHRFKPRRFIFSRCLSCFLTRCVFSSSSRDINLSSAGLQIQTGAALKPLPFLLAHKSWALDTHTRTNKHNESRKRDKEISHTN